VGIDGSDAAISAALWATDEAIAGMCHFDWFTPPTSRLLTRAGTGSRSPRLNRYFAPPRRLWRRLARRSKLRQPLSCGTTARLDQRITLSKDAVIIERGFAEARLRRNVDC
jgi:hypothetical protein